MEDQFAADTSISTLRLVMMPEMRMGRQKKVAPGPPAVPDFLWAGAELWLLT